MEPKPKKVNTSVVIMLLCCCCFATTAFADGTAKSTSQLAAPPALAASLSDACKAAATDDLDARVADKGFRSRGGTAISGGGGGSANNGVGISDEKASGTTFVRFGNSIGFGRFGADDYPTTDDGSDTYDGGDGPGDGAVGDGGSRKLLTVQARRPRAPKAMPRWGPDPITFPAWAQARSCGGGGESALLAAKRYRLLGAMMRLTELGFCYCHHHTLWWYPTPGIQDTCVADCVGTRAMPKQGVDCSNWSSYLYNLAFGVRFTSGIGKQACSPSAAPGRMLPYTTQQQDSFQPGDLLYITSSSGVPAPTRVAHVILWTGLTVDFASSGGPLSWDTLLANMRPAKRAAAEAYATARRAAGLPVYVINDSTWTGPNYRPFAGNYITGFSHARRVLLTDAEAKSLPAYNPAVASWDGKDCISYWALQGAGSSSG